MTTRTRASAGIGLALALSLLATTQAAAAELDPTGRSAETAATAFAEAAPQAPGELVPAATVDGTFAASSGSSSVVAPEDGTGELVVDGALSIALPPEATTADGVLTDDGSLVYPAESTGASSVVQPLAGGVRIATVLEDASASMSYTYRLEGAVPVLQTDGSVLLYEPTATLAPLSAEQTPLPIGAIEAPWAVDASGAAVATRYEVVGDAVVQVVEPTAATEFPVVADPTAWWGMYWTMSSTTANRISAALYAGSGVAALASILIATGVVTAPGAVATGIAAAVMTIGGAVISYCNARGRGIVIAKPWVGPPYCYSR